MEIKYYQKIICNMQTILREYSLKEKILERKPSINLIASGGITSIKDLSELKRIKIKESIVGKAIYEKQISLSELNNDY